MKIAIVGAGGVGAYYGGVLARAGHDVGVVARGAHLEAIRSRGLEVRSVEGSFITQPQAVADGAELAGAALAIVAVKAYSLDEVASTVATLAAGGADVLPLLNGVEAADNLAAAGVPRARIIGGLTTVSVARVDPGVVERFSPFARIVIGELAGGASPRTDTLAGAFREAGIDARASTEIELELWRKFAFIAAFAAGCGLSRTSVGPLRQTPLGSLLLERAVRETGSIARARGLPFTSDHEEAALSLIHEIAADLKPSFLLDLEAGGRTELDVLSGAVARMGRELGLPVPVHETTVGALGPSSA